MKAEEFDAKFENGEDITEFLDLSKASRPGHVAHLICTGSGGPDAHPTGG